MKKNTGQLWKNQYIIFSGNSYITELRKMGYDQAKLQVEYETEESEKQIICLDAETKKTFLTQRLQKNSVQKMFF